MSLTRLIYSSQADLDIRLSDVKEILLSARKNNAKLDVCGMLYYDSRFFLQTLEGEEDKVNKIFYQIEKDFRHDNIKLISKSPIDRALFSQWSMGYAGNTSAVQDVLKKLNLDTHDFHQLNAEDALQVLLSLSKVQ